MTFTHFVFIFFSNYMIISCKGYENKCTALWECPETFTDSFEQRFSDEKMCVENVLSRKIIKSSKVPKKIVKQ